MKKIFSFFAAALAFAGCTRYELNTDFRMPDELVSPTSEIALDVTSSQTVVLSWNGGGAVDGGIVLYNVLFDKEGGDFTEPVASMPSDLGARPSLTLSHSQLNVLARKAGIKAGEAGKLIWTVSGAKGGKTTVSDMVGTIRVLRGEGIDNIPEHLFINGAAALEAGQEFRLESDGVFVIYTKLGAGEVKFSSEKNGGFNFFVNSENKLAEGEGSHTIEAPATGLGRLTVDFNTLSVKIDEIGNQVRCIWGANYVDIAVLEYTGNGDFVGDGDVVFLGPGREGTPDWCSWVEERYYFIAQVNGEDMCWGSTFGSGSWGPDGTEEFWYVVENPWEQWNNLWKMDHAYDMCHVTYTINTNKDNHMVHSYTGGAIEYKQPESTPEALFLNGAAAEAQNQAMRKEGDKFVIYNKLSSGEISLVDGAGQKYFADADGKLFIGAPKTKVEASEGVTRITVDFAAKTISYDKIGDKVWVENAWDHIVMAELSYQGLGNWAGEGQIKFAASGDERYSLRTTVNGVNMRWGSNRGNDGKLPETEEEWYLYESEWEGHQWDNLYKFNKDDQDKDATFQVIGNDPVHMRHAVIVKSGEPQPPTVAPADLALSGSAAEVEGQAFRKVKDGVFTVIARFKDGELCFKSGSKNYFVDSEKGLLEGNGTATVVASEEGYVTRITVDFTTCSVSADKVGEYAHLKFAGTYRDVAHLKYEGNGIFRASDAEVKFIDNAEASWVTWGAEERYYFIIEVNGVEKCWGRHDAAVHNDLKYNGDESFWNMDEFTWSQWDHCWKFAAELNGARADIEINTNDNGLFKHSVTKR